MPRLLVINVVMSIRPLQDAFTRFVPCHRWASERPFFIRKFGCRNIATLCQLLSFGDYYLYCGAISSHSFGGASEKAVNPSLLKRIYGHSHFNDQSVVSTETHGGIRKPAKLEISIKSLNIVLNQIIMQNMTVLPKLDASR